MANLWLYLGSAFATGWGIAHWFPTASVVRGFGNLTADNKNILTMEWLMEGAALVYIGVSVAVLAAMGGTKHPLGVAYFRMAAVGLVGLAVISFFTGARVSQIPFKICAPLFLTAAVLMFVGSCLGRQG